MAMDPIPFRLRIGVIGHRTLDNPDKVAQGVRELLRGPLLSDLGLDESSSRVTPIEFSAVTSLADGADRLLAQLVLERAGARLEVILPFAAPLFRGTLDSDAHREEFDWMLAMDRSPRVLRQEQQPDDETAKSFAYRDGARELLNNCDVLIALWDEQPPRGPGGTGETVEIARRRRRPLYIVSPEGKVTFERGDGVNVEPIEGLEKFNRTPEPSTSVLSNADTGELAFFRSTEGGQVPEAHRTAIHSILVPAYVRASTLARKNQIIYLTAGLWIYILAPVAVMCVALAAAGETFERGLFICEAFLLAIVFYLYWWGEHGKYQERWMTNRFLAERLRGAFFLGACGLDPLPIDVPPHLGLAHRPADWPVRAFNEIWQRMPALVRCAGDGCEDLVAFVGKYWIEDQTQFHESRSKHYGFRARWLERVGLGFFAFTFFVSLTHIFLVEPKDLTHIVPVEKKDLSKELLTFLAIALPAITASAAAYRGYREFERLEKRSEQMVESLKDVNQRLATVRNASQLQQRMREMEILSLRETQDWLMLVRFTHLEPA
jgi:hypothetical protein